MEKPQLFRSDMLPRKCDVIRHVSFLRTHNGLTKQHAYRQTAQKIYEIWNKADCLPVCEKIIIGKIKNLLEKELRKPCEVRKSRKGKHKRSKSVPASQPTRRSIRTSAETIVSDDQCQSKRGEQDDSFENKELPSEKDDSFENKELPSEKLSNVRTRAQVGENAATVPDLARINWMETDGLELFDVLSTEKLTEKKNKNADAEDKNKKKKRTFDKDFYEDQKGLRQRKVEKVINEEFQEEEKEFVASLERKKRRFELAHGSSETTSCSFDDYEMAVDAEPTDLDFNIQSPRLSDVSATEALYQCSTRRKPLENDIAKTSRSCQTDPVEFPKIPVRQGKFINAVILETAVECETVARCSMDTTVKVLQIIANKIFGQNWSLPLSMNDKYVRDMKTLRQLKKGMGIPESSSNQDQEDDAEIEYEISCLPDDNLPVEVDDREAKIVALEVKIENHKKGKDSRLPSPKSIRNTRQLIAYEAERLIGLEMLSNQCALIPDGTGRKVVGKVGGVVVQTKDNRLRTLPFQKMANEKRENWSELIDYLLQRLSVLSGEKKLEFWKCILLFISDQCKINKGLAEAVAQKLGATHKPGQVFCNIHPILMFDEKVKKKWSYLERQIGAEKLFPSLNYANLDQETFMVSIQCLDGMMALISPGKSHKAWSRYFDFNRYISPKVNRAYCLKDRRFGQLPALCLVALHHFDDLISYLDSVPACRNQLGCLCRGMIDIEDYLKFIWAGAGLLGIHLYEPYLNLIIDLNTPQSKLLTVFPHLYDEMISPSASFCKTDVSAFESLAVGWQLPTSVDSPYKHDVVSTLQGFIDETDQTFMETHVKSLLVVIASG